MARSRSIRPLPVLFVGSGLAAALLLGVTPAADAATVIDGPVGLGTAAPFGVLGASTVTNTGPTVVRGDLGLSPGTAVTGFGAAPNGVVTGTVHRTDAVAAQARADARTADGTGRSLSPTRTGLSELDGLSLTPGVYDGPALRLAGGGDLTLAGAADSVWVFRTASTLTVGSASRITITGGASSCNVFWLVGSSATLGTAAQFQGTVIADQSVTATTGATVAGRLLALDGAVTLDSNTITAPTGCAAPGTPVQTASPAITSGTPTSATVGTPYAFTVTASGTPSPTFTATGLPAGLTIDAASGVVSGTPTTPGTTTVTVTASNGTAPDVSATYEVVTALPTAPPTEAPAPPVPTATPTAPVPSATPTAPAPSATPTAGTPTPAASATSGATATATADRTGAGGTGGTGTGVRSLAFTGADVAGPIGIAAAALALGIVLAVLARRRSRRS